MINVLVAEDSTVVQKLIVSILDREPGIRVAGIAENGAVAVEMACSLKPDIITMDIRMPKLDGFEATKQIMSCCPTPIVIVSASLPSDMDDTFSAVKAGALMVIEKPRGLTSADYENTRNTLVSTVKLMSAVRVVRRWHKAPTVSERLAMKKSSAKITTKIVAIGASTGGPTALSQVLRRLPKEFSVPIMIVQHITPGFGGAFADWLSGESGLKISVPHSGEPLADGAVYLAPDNTHMGVTARGRIVLTEQSNYNHHKPSINHLFESVAKAYGAEAIGVILTGMGEDGAHGLKEMQLAGGRTVAQDEQTCVVFGMPKVAISLGAADRVVPLEDVAGAILNLSE